MNNDQNYSNFIQSIASSNLTFEALTQILIDYILTMNKNLFKFKYFRNKGQV